MILSLSVVLGVVASSGLQPGMNCASRICSSMHPSSDPSNPRCEIPADSSTCPSKCCANKQCSECRQLPECKTGEELICSGSFDFRFLCKPCPNGTYSDSKNRCCTPWIDCKTLGLKCLQPGNRTHNVQCGQDPITVIIQPDRFLPPSDSTLTTVLAVLTAAGIFILILMTFCLLVCTWMQKAEKFPIDKEPEIVSGSNLPESQHLREDSFSCQFPEEEHGDKMAGELSLNLPAH
ncbi:tumor necrosis factor receptor superfamily member 18 [Hemicordylus capensis]|uniref:tumor necrosis factor receptor superfamily member 18 n=1 Tax=Hemicordylus capensis TaxID=884348 RepID=UPI002304A64A|nr:tumor necrosis factor receptor superfamily member 18 [Hemicordylus capensis]